MERNRAAPSTRRLPLIAPLSLVRHLVVHLTLVGWRPLEQDVHVLIAATGPVCGVVAVFGFVVGLVGGGGCGCGRLLFRVWVYATGTTGAGRGKVGVEGAGGCGAHVRARGDDAGRGGCGARGAVGAGPGELDGGVEAGDLLVEEENRVEEFLGGFAVFEGDFRRGRGGLDVGELADALGFCQSLVEEQTVLEELTKRYCRRVSSFSDTVKSTPVRTTFLGRLSSE